MFNKKAISPIVATISVVLLTVVAAGLIAAYIIPLITGNLEKTECFNYRDYFVFEEEYGYNCFNVSGSDRWYGISVGTTSIDSEKEEAVEGFRLVFKKEGESDALSVLSGEPESNEIWMLDPSLNVLVIPKSGEVRTFVYNTTTSYESVGVAAILKSGKTCDESDSIKINELCEYSLIV